MINDLKLIKKYYGEAMAHLCRELFPTLLDTDGLLFNLLSIKFAYSKSLYEDIINEDLIAEFKNYIYSLVNVETKTINTKKTPFELMKEVGYSLYECKTEDDIQRFKKYYINGEELCTFCGHRLDSCYVFFAVRNDAEFLNREDFKNPVREDNYGTSVISIQFSKEKTNYLSIKNRYNHHVNNPDATFGNNLDNIIPGLTNSFEEYYHFNINSNNERFEISGYILASDQKFYKYNCEINNIYFCPNNMIIENGKKITNYKDKSRYFFLDYIIIDMKEKKLINYAEVYDTFFNKYDNYKSLDIKKEKDGYLIKIITDGTTYIKVDFNGCIKSYKNEKIENISDFLTYDRTIEKFDMPNLKNIGKDVLYNNRMLKKLSLPSVETIGENFLYNNLKIEEFSAPKLTDISYNFLYFATALKKINIENVESIKDNFLYSNYFLEEFYAPKLKKLGSSFLFSNSRLIKINIENVKEIGNDFLSYNKVLKNIVLPNVEIIGTNFLINNNEIKKIILPKVKIIQIFFLRNNTDLEIIELPNVEVIFCGFLENNKKIKKINLPNALEISSDFMAKNTILDTFEAPKLQTIQNDFLFNNQSLKQLYLPSLVSIGLNFLYYNNSLTNIDLPNIVEIGRDCLYWNNTITNIEFYNLIKIKNGFMQLNENSLKRFIAPKLSIIPDKTFEFNKSLEYIELSKNEVEIKKFVLNNHPNREEIIESLFINHKWDRDKTMCKKMEKNIV